jgi:hypothetical protein
MLNFSIGRDASMALIGFAVRLEVTFRTFAGLLIDPVDIFLNIYEEGSHTPIETVNGTALTKSSVGVYYYDYVIPDGVGNLEYEFTGTANGVPIGSRATLPRTWKRT